METNKKPESIIQYNPYRPPKEKHGEGEWRVFERHVEKGYPLKWQWVAKTDPNLPPEDPPAQVVSAQSDLGGGKFDPNIDTSGSDYTDH